MPQCGTVFKATVCDPLQGICLQLKVWRRGWQRAGWGQEGSYRPPPPPLPLGGNSNLSTCPPPLWPPQPGSFTSSGTGRSTNDPQRKRVNDLGWLLLNLEDSPFQERRGVSARVPHTVDLLLSKPRRSLILPCVSWASGGQDSIQAPWMG